MREQIQAYVNGLFADAALTIRNAEVRQEILQHTLAVSYTHLTLPTIRLV